MAAGYYVTVLSATAHVCPGNEGEKDGERESGREDHRRKNGRRSRAGYFEAAAAISTKWILITTKDDTWFSPLLLGPDFSALPRPAALTPVAPSSSCPSGSPVTGTKSLASIPSPSQRPVEWMIKSLAVFISPFPSFLSPSVPRHDKIEFFDLYGLI